MCQRGRVRKSKDSTQWKRETQRRRARDKEGSPLGLPSYVTQHKRDSSFMWTHCECPSLLTSTIHKPQPPRKTCKYQAATHHTDHSWPTYSHLIILACYPQCNMALHPMAHVTVSNNARLFRQSEYIYSWLPLMETPAFQSSLTASGRQGEWASERKRGPRDKARKEERERYAPPPRLSWNGLFSGPLRARLLSNMACEWDSSLSSLQHINSSDCEASALPLRRIDTLIFKEQIQSLFFKQNLTQ